MPMVRNGHLIRKAYEDRGLRRKGFAELLGIPPRTLGNICGGRDRQCSYPIAVRIANALGWQVADVIADVPALHADASDDSDNQASATRGAA